MNDDSAPHDVATLRTAPGAVPARPALPLAHRVGAIVLLALAYFVAGKTALLLAIPPGYATAVWPASGIALGALLLGGRGLWPGVVLGSFLTNMATVGGGEDAVLRAVGVATLVAAGAGAQAVVGERLTRHALARDPGLLTPRSTISVLALGGPLACLASASVGVTTLWAAGLLPGEEAAFNWATWWVGDTIGVLLALPLMLAALARPRAVSTPRVRGLALPLVVTLVAVIAVYLLVSRQEQARVAGDFERESAVVANALDRRLAVYEEAVRGVRRLYATNKNVNAIQFASFVRHTLEREPGIQALSWNPRILARDRAALEAATRAEGFEDFRITERAPDGTLLPAAERPEHVVVRYIEPQASNEAALGFDIASNPARRAALHRARDSGEPQATAGITLVQESGRQMGILLLAPVYEGGRLPDDLAERRESLIGYAVGVFRMGDVLASGLRGLDLMNVDVSLLDATEGESPLARILVDGSGGQRLVAPEVPKPATPLVSVHSLHMAGRQWRLELRATPAYVATHRSLAAWSVLAGGLSLAGLLGAFLLVLTGRGIMDESRAQALETSNEQLADAVRRHQASERALAEEKERAEVTLHSIGDAVITTDADGAVEYLNPVAERITGWRTAEAHGRPITDVFRIINEETREPAVDPVERCRREGRVIGLANHTVLVNRSGREFAIEDSAAPIRDRDGDMIGVILVFHDVSEWRRMAREAAYHASHDALTGLVNRREFDRRLEQALASAKQYGTHHALCYLDLDQFKIVNDTAGHRAGDELLKHLTALLSRHVRDRDTVARLGGDEFGLLLSNCPMDKAVEIAESLIAAVRDFTFTWQGRSFEIGASAGLVAISDQTATAEELLAHADVACYAAKDAGRNRVRIYRPDSGGADPRHREIMRAADMRNAVDNDRFRLHAQPIWSLAEDSGDAPSRYELLVRMLDEDGQEIPPADFIPGAERYAIMHHIDRWVIRTAFRDHASLFPGRWPVPLAINLSGNSLNDEGLLAFLREQIEICAINPAQVCFEITETAAVRNLSAASRFITAARGMGLRFALDDFGSGLSSFAYLKSLPVDYLKIDGSLVRNVAHDANDRAMVAAINQLAHRLGIETVAEYAESEACVATLRELGVDHAQGFALGRPTALPLAG